jgi:hypothetical protein
MCGCVMAITPPVYRLRDPGQTGYIHRGGLAGCSRVPTEVVSEHNLSLGTVTLDQPGFDPKVYIIIQTTYENY